MKFRFCGDGDCPDWVLAEIISSLSPMPCSSLMTLAQLVADKINGLGFAELKVKEAVSSVSKDAEKTAVACMHFLLISAARHNATTAVFNEELQQLGMPKEHADAVADVLSKNAQQIRQQLIEQSVKINELHDVQTLPASSTTTKCTKLVLDIKYALVDNIFQNQQEVLHIDKANVGALLMEMHTVKKLIQKYMQDS